MAFNIVSLMFYNFKLITPNNVGRPGDLRMLYQYQNCHKLGANISAQCRGNTAIYTFFSANFAVPQSLSSSSGDKALRSAPFASISTRRNLLINLRFAELKASSALNPM